MGYLLRFVFVFLLMPAVSVAELGALDSMVMPGKVIEGHSKFESSCSSCHVLFNKKAQDKVCMQCHDHANIKKDVLAKKGFHGRQKGKVCRDCHQDHKGRKADIVKLNKKKFDHQKTDFPLGGKHKKEKCKSCHKPGDKFNKAPSKCYACHKKDDEHKGGLGKDCGSCHVDRGWKKIRFDHDKTGYALRGKHAKAKCVACHKRHKYKNTPTTCYACHKKDDKHKGQQGKKCGSCHNARSWETTSFDHGLSRFPLLGKHKRVKCKKCHKTKKFRDASIKCYSCHKKEDEHKGRLGTQCEQCHNARGWKYWKFNHDRQTGFPLKGGHKGLDCLVCHSRPLKGKVSLPGTCVGCHSDDDVHDGRFGEYCERCHTVNDFGQIRHGVGR